MVGAQLAQDAKNVVPIEGLGEAEEALVLDVRVCKGGNVETGVVGDVDEVF